MESPREDNMPTDHTPDHIMDTTEARDASGDDAVSVANAEAPPGDEEDDAGLFGSGSEDEEPR